MEEPLTVLPSTTDPNSNLIEASSEVPNDEIKQSGPQARPDTVHLHGVDDMSTKDIEAYFAEYQPSKIEWVNDTSCKLKSESFFFGEKHLTFTVNYYLYRQRSVLIR